MKYLRRILYGLGLLLLAACLLLWFLPASWVVPRIASKMPGMRLEQVSGLVWNGSVGRVVGADGHVAGQLQWQLSRRALLGKIHAQWHFTGPALEMSGTMERPSADQIALNTVDMGADLLLSGRSIGTPLGQPRGKLQLHVDHALLQGGWPLELQAGAQWHDAAMQTPEGLVSLGELIGSAQAHGGVIQVQLHDDGHGPLMVDGQLQIIPLGWRLDATLQARSAAPPLRRWLHQLGPVDDQGRVHVQRQGGLAGSATSSPTTEHP